MSFSAVDRGCTNRGQPIESLRTSHRHYPSRKARTPEHRRARIFILPRFVVVLGARKDVLGGANGEDGGAIFAIGPGNDEDGAEIFIIPPGKNLLGSSKVNLGASKDDLGAGNDEVEPRKMIIPPGNGRVPAGSSPIGPGKTIIPPGKKSIGAGKNGNEPRIHRNGDGVLGAAGGMNEPRP